MAFAVWRILRLPAATPGRGAALVAFFGQLVLNVAWSWLFFAAHSPLLGIVDIVPQWVLVVVAAALFMRLDAVAGWCLVPLALWVAYAGVLTVSIFMLNG